MYKTIRRFILDWMSKLLFPIVKSKFILKDTFELEAIEHKETRLPYVLLENRAIAINNSIFPIKLENIRLDIYNKGQKIGKVVYDNGVSISPKSFEKITMEVRLSHITAIFQMFRFLIVDTVNMNIEGDIQIKLFGMTFFIPIKETVEIPRDKYKAITSSVIEDTGQPESIPFEEVIVEESFGNTGSKETGEPLPPEHNLK